MTEIEALELKKAAEARERERQEILAELRQERQQELVRQESRNLRGRDLIARGLRKA